MFQVIVPCELSTIEGVIHEITYQDEETTMVIKTQGTFKAFKYEGKIDKKEKDSIKMECKLSRIITIIE